jgi:hypothetical protein
MKLYWSTCARGKNFGDVLSTVLIKHYTGIEPVWSTAEESNVVCIGSILSHLPKQYTGTVAGIGTHSPVIRKDLSQANVLALRGPLTLKSVSLSPDQDKPVLGDPGLLSDRLLDSRPKIKYKLGYVPHYSDKSPVPKNAYVIDVTKPVLEVIEEIGSCEAIVSSSLHGLIVADSFGLPRMWSTFDKVQGKGFKFHDYSKSLCMTAIPNRFETAPLHIISKKKEKLERVISCLQ